MKKFLLLTFSCFLIFATNAQIVNIPDANFKNALLTHSPVIDLNNDGQIQVSEAQAVLGNIFVSNKNISDLTGIEAFVNIQALYCDRNHITSLTINNFSRISTISCNENNLTSLTLTNSPQIVILYCQLNQLTSLVLSGLPTLKVLDCHWNQLTTMIFNPSAPLQSLDCSFNQFTTLPSFNTNFIRTLDCYNNLMSSLTLGNSPVLQSLNCSNNKLSTLSLTNFPALLDITCSYNLLTSLNLSNLPALKSLWCAYNQLTGLTLSNLPTFNFMQCSYNSLLSSLTLTNLPALQYLYASYCKLDTLKLNNFPALLRVDCNWNHLKSLSITNAPLFSTLICEPSNDISNLQLANLPSLTNLDCINNQLTELDLSQTGVKSLACGGNPDLISINIKNNSISATPATFHVVGLTQLQSICVDDAELAYITSRVNATLPGQPVSVSSFCNFNPGGNYNTLIGQLRFDETINGCGALDSTMQNVRITIDDGTQTGSTYTDAQGNYKFFATQPNNTVIPVFENPYFVSTPSAQTITFVGYGNTQVADFCITKNGIHPDLEITLLPVTIARPGFDAQYKLVYRNKGNQILSGTATLNFDALKLNFLTAIPNVSGQTAGNLSWSYSGLSPYQTKMITLTFHVNAPPVVNIGDILPFTVVINPITGDETPGDNTFNFNQVVRGAFDPNDKDVTEGQAIDISKKGDYLHYIVRFQNTGNAAATSVIIKDSLADNVDWNSLVPVNASHPYRTVISKGNKVEFIFEGINLPSKNVNEPASHGFVSFKIKPRPTVGIGEIIRNKADIYFDFNTPVITNTVTTVITETKNNSDPAGLTVSPNPAKDWLQFSLNPDRKLQSVTLINSVGVKVYSEEYQNTGTRQKLNISNLAPGVYFLIVYSYQWRSIQKVMIVK